jgi:PAS domain S-box-containing protein
LPPFTSFTVSSVTVFHLLAFLILEAMAGAAFMGWFYTRNPDYRRMLGAFAGLLVLRAVLIVVHTAAPQGLTPLLCGLEALNLVLLGWAFTAAVLPARRGGALYLLVGALVAAACAAASLLVGAGAEGVQTPFWHALHMLLAALPVIVLQTSSQRGEHWLSSCGFALLGLATLALLVGALPGAGGGQGSEGLAGVPTRVGWLGSLIAYTLLAVAAFRTILQDMWAYRQELRAVSEEALRQTRELLFLVETTRALGGTVEIEQVLNRVAENIALALDADRCAILLSAPDQPDQMVLAAHYTPLRRPAGPEGGVAFALAEHAVLERALRRGRQLAFSGGVNHRALRPLCTLLGIGRAGPTLLQPLIHREQPQGVLLAANDRCQRAFSANERQLCESIAVQLSAALANAQLYRSLGSQTRQVAALLRSQENGQQRQTHILESISEGVIVSDADGRITIVNAAAERILGTTRERLLGRVFAGILGSAATEAAPSAEAPPAPDGALRTVFELENRVVHVSAAPILAADGPCLGTVAILRDITRETEAERSKSEFISAISHELRTPITNIRGYAEALTSGMVGPLTPSQAHFLRIVYDNALRMVSLAENLIAASQIERGRLKLNYEMADLHLLIGEVVQSFRGQIENRQLEIGLELDPRLPLIEADPARVRQVVDNLLSNAIRFTYPGGHITVGAKLAPGEDARHPQHCIVWVTDSGIGISPEEQLHIWERFYRPANILAEEAGGLGIGLSIVKSLVEAHGGRVWVESTPGVGSTFTALFPVRRADASLARGA